MFLTAEFTPRSDLQFIFTGIAQQIYLEALMGPSLPATQTMGGNVQPYGHANATVGSSSIGRYDPYAPPRRPVPSASTTASTILLHLVSYVFSMNFLLLKADPSKFASKPSPFVRVERAVSGIVECPGMPLELQVCGRN